MKRINIGQQSSFKELPAEVTLDREDYFLVKNDSEYRLISRNCPHAGGTVANFGSELVCPLHYWSFDRNTGECTNVPGADLTCFKVTVEEDGNLFVEFPN